MDPVEPEFLELTGQNEIDFRNGKAILIYSSWGTNEDTEVDGDSTPPNCMTRLVDGEAVSTWAYCTDLLRHSCRNYPPVPDNFTQQANNPKFDPSLDPLGLEKERIISYILLHGYGIGQHETSWERFYLQNILWCTSEADPGEK